MTSPRAFLADEMLGKLARWMRFMGFDVAYVKNLGDTGILAAARAESRFLLTRDVELAERGAKNPGSLLVRAHDPREQLREIVAALALPVDREDLLSRCSVCNVVLEPVPRDSVRERVPPRVVEDHEDFFECRSCRRVYWPGTHAARIARDLAEFSGPSGPSRVPD